MVELQEFKNIITGMISQKYELKFLGKNFKKTVNSLSEIQAQKIYDWIEKTIETKQKIITKKGQKKYKTWQTRELISFRYALKINNIAYRILLVKVKNEFYIEFHLGNHSYYDDIRKDLNLKS